MPQRLSLRYSARGTTAWRRRAGRVVTASQSSGERKASGATTRIFAARPLVAGSFTSAVETAVVGSSGRPWAKSGEPQKVARATQPSGPFHGTGTPLPRQP
eukprot:3936331-Alexandrium_andersonii.AAC.1